MKKILMLITALAVFASAAPRTSYQYIAGQEFKVTSNICVKGYKWTMYTSTLDNRVVSFKEDLVNKPYGGTKKVYCNGHNASHYGNNGYPNENYVRYNQDNGIGVTTAVLGAAGMATLGYLAGKSLSPSGKTVIVKKTIINNNNNNKGRKNYNTSQTKKNKASFYKKQNALKQQAARKAKVQASIKKRAATKKRAYQKQRLKQLKSKYKGRK